MSTTPHARWLRRTSTLLGLVAVGFSPVLACGRTPTVARPAASPSSKAASPSSKTSCGRFGPAQRLGKLSKKVREASGLVVSQRDPSVLWVHNDGKNGRIYGVSADEGKIVAAVTLKNLSPAANDWEELSAAPCKSTKPTAVGPARCLIVGDIGDNHGRRAAIVFHRFAEPNPRGGKQSIAQYETMIVRYPKGKSYNSEAFVMDKAGTIWIWTKGDKNSRLFRVPFRAGRATLSFVAKIKTARAMHIRPGHGARLTAAAWDGTTRRLLLRSYDAAWELCLGAAGLKAMPSATWHRIAVPAEKQGEAIAVGGGGFYLVSEGKRPRIYLLRRR